MVPQEERVRSQREPAWREDDCGGSGLTCCCIIFVYGDSVSINRIIKEERGKEEPE